MKEGIEKRSGERQSPTSPRQRKAWVAGTKATDTSKGVLTRKVEKRPQSGGTYKSGTSKKERVAGVRRVNWKKNGKKKK